MATRRRSAPSSDRAGFGVLGPGYLLTMLYTILIILAIVALLLFIFGRSRI